MKATDPARGECPFALTEIWCVGMANQIGIRQIGIRISFPATKPVLIRRTAHLDNLEQGHGIPGVYSLHKLLIDSY